MSQDDPAIPSMVPKPRLSQDCIDTREANEATVHARCIPLTLLLLYILQVHFYLDLVASSRATCLLIQGNIVYEINVPVPCEIIVDKFGMLKSGAVS